MCFIITGFCCRSVCIDICFCLVRCAWWNLPDSLDDDSRSNASCSRKSNKRLNSNRSTRKEVFPAFDDPIPLDTQTNLWPPQRLLRENNMSATRCHSATSIARFLPHLSDRPASVRHLQIDTTAVGFPKIGGEIEPMFCKLAIYHFELSSENRVVEGGRDANRSAQRQESESTSASLFAPSPNMERCGPVTEFLHFDVVQDPQVIQNCKHALWPYAKESDDVNESHGITTSCGMFPLPRNLSISNLYAVIIVNKVIADGTELQPYYKPGRHATSPPENFNLEKLREAAKVACSQYGQFTHPFVFGVVPLRHVIDNESPQVPLRSACYLFFCHDHAI